MGRGPQAVGMAAKRPTIKPIFSNASDCGSDSGHDYVKINGVF
jgi:hypothetical protein